MADLIRFADLAPSPRMPVLFVGHGNPMNAIEDNPYSRTWRQIGEGLPVPRAILVVSAHWMTRGVTMVHVKDRPKTIHDFGGFPRELFEQQYAAPGAPGVASATIDLLQHHHIEPDVEWGLDHGAWSVLIQMFPKADIPVFQLSLDLRKSPAEHYALAADLKALREKGVMIIGSGNVVHNLRALSWEGKPYDWAVAFDAHIADRLKAGDYRSLADIGSLGRITALAHPTVEHFLPVLYPLATAHEQDELRFFNEGIDMGSISMRSFLLS